ncbi:MAG TPA: hypothetical protein VNB54_04605 [Alphaproteobacteria bacterium]|nr:hypothetical protein [Alphaproteobacteria bacterium]
MKRAQIAALNCAFLFALTAFAFQTPQSIQSDQKHGQSLTSDELLLTIDQQVQLMSNLFSLTKDQQTKLKPILIDANQKQRTIKDDNSLSLDDKRRKIGNLCKATLSKIYGLLTESNELTAGTLLKREMQSGVDNYPYAAYSFKFGGNGPETQKLCRNNWELLFGNSPEPDSFDVTMVTDDRSRIRDLGSHTWEEKFAVPNLPAYEKPQREPSVKALEGHIYVVHSRDTDTDLYALFRVEKLESGERVEITWKLIPEP